MRTIGITVLDCERDEAEMFRALAPRLHVIPTLLRGQALCADAAAACGNRCVSVSHKSRVSAARLLSLRKAGVLYLSTRSAGTDHIDLTAAQSVGIAVGNVAYSPDSVADYTLMLMLMALRNAKRVITAAERYDFRPDAARGKELRDMTVGVVGNGRIGTAVIHRLRGFGCRILFCGRTPAPGATPLPALLAQSDLITLHTPLAADTHHLIGGEQLQTMRQGAFLINTGRGALVDTDALLHALESGRLGGAALDVLEGEEGLFYFDHSENQAEDTRLRKLSAMPNVIITPHTAYYTGHALRDTVEKTIQNCLDFERSFHDA